MLLTALIMCFSKILSSKKQSVKLLVEELMLKGFAEVKTFTHFAAVVVTRQVSCVFWTSAMTTSSLVNIPSLSRFYLSSADSVLDIVWELQYPSLSLNSKTHSL